MTSKYQRKYLSNVSQLNTNSPNNLDLGICTYRKPEVLIKHPMCFQHTCPCYNDTYTIYITTWITYNCNYKYMSCTLNCLSTYKQGGPPSWHCAILILSDKKNSLSVENTHRRRGQSISPYYSIPPSWTERRDFYPTPASHSFTHFWNPKT